MLLLLVRLLDLLLLQHLIPIQMQATHSFLELVQLLFACWQDSTDTCYSAIMPTVGKLLSMLFML